MPPENNTAPQISSERITRVNLLKILFAERFWYVLYLFSRVDRQPCLAQGMVVNVRRVDLHVLAEPVRPDRLGEKDCQGIGFSPTGAACAPYADRVFS